MIPNYIIAGLWGAIGGIALIIGSLVGYKYNISNRIIAIITAFGSGILISAVCFELLFEAYFYGGIYPTTIGFVSGVVVFTIIDAIIHKFSIERFKTDHGSIINTESKHDNSTDNISEYNNSIYNSFKYNNSNNTTNNFNIIKHRYTKYFNK
jgi:ZIP family zinc transporter